MSSQSRGIARPRFIRTAYICRRSTFRGTKEKIYAPVGECLLNPGTRETSRPESLPPAIIRVNLPKFPSAPFACFQCATSDVLPKACDDPPGFAPQSVKGLAHRPQSSCPFGCPPTIAWPSSGRLLLRLPGREYSAEPVDSPSCPGLPVAKVTKTWAKTSAAEYAFSI